MGLVLKPTKILYIKLGSGGDWASECLDKNMIKIGYREVLHTDCVNGNWYNVEKQLERIRTNRGAIKRDLNQIKAFYESDNTVMWVTFHGDLLRWAFAHPKVMSLPTGDRMRETVGPWKCTDNSGKNKLSKDKLIGSVLSMEGYRGTICSVKESAYLLKKINGQTPREIEQATVAHQELVARIEVLIKKLHWQDFEDLIDRIFREGGWKRTGDRRKTQQTIDLLLLSPITKEKISVQVKSRSGWAEYLKYRKRFSEMQESDRFFFVVHSPDPRLEREDKNTSLDEGITYWGPKDVARLCVDYGLSEWVMQKVG